MLSLTRSRKTVYHGNEVGPLHQVLLVVGEQVAQLRVDDIFHDLFSYVAFFLQNPTHDVLHLADYLGKPVEQLADQLGSQVLQVDEDVVQRVEGRLAHLVQLRLYQVEEGVDRWEPES